jgi:preprotein translocase subunit SecA
LVEFKNEAFGLFEGLVARIDQELSRRLFRINVGIPQSEIPLDRAVENVDTKDDTGLTEEKPEPKKNSATIGRNDPCWCGSGKKWKRCHYPQQKTS